MLALWLTVALQGSPEQWVLLKPGAEFLPPEGIATDAGTRYRSCCNELTRTVAVRFVRDAGELVEIETPGAPLRSELHCAATAYDDAWFGQRLGLYQLRAFVRRSDLLVVTRGRVVAPGFTLASGLPLEWLDGGLAHFGLYETTREFTVPLSPTETGLTYAPAEWLDVEPTNPDAGTEYRQRLAVLGEVADGGSIALLPGEWWQADAVRVDGTNATVTIRPPCARLNARVPKGALMEVQAQEHPMSFSSHMCGEASETAARKGALLFWPDGRPAGRLVDEDWLFRPRAAMRGLQCFDLTFQNTSGSLPLCFREVDLRHFKPGTYKGLLP